MHFDEILAHVGEFGRFQQIVYFTSCILAIPVNWHVNVQVSIDDNKSILFEIVNIKMI